MEIEHGVGGLARLAGFPPEGAAVPVRLRIREGASRWERDFDGHRMCSQQRLVEYKGQMLIAERFDGQPLEVWMRLEPYTNGLRYVSVAARIWGIPIPAPQVKASVKGDLPGRIRTEIDIQLPLIGRLVRYRGWLEVVVLEDEEDA
jgi:hypothetical protein